MVTSNDAFDRIHPNLKDTENPETSDTEKSKHERIRAARCKFYARQEGGANRLKIKILNHRFRRDITRLENTMSLITTADKSVASKWIAKLKARPKTLSEALARNYILSYLLQCNVCKAFRKAPFNFPPAINRLSSITTEIPPVITSMKNVHELYENSTDNGAFLNKLPVPRDGAFCIMHLRPNVTLF